MGESRGRKGDGFIHSANVSQMLSVCQALPWAPRAWQVALLFWLCIDFLFCSYLGYDVSASPRSGLSSFSPSSASWSKTTEHSGDQQRTNKTGWLRPCPHLQFSDGSDLSGEWESAVLALNWFFLFWMIKFPHSLPLMLLLPVVSWRAEPLHCFL